MNDRQSMSSYDPSRLNSYNPNPNTASSYNPNAASSYNPNVASSYNPNAAGGYNPNPAPTFGSAQPQTGGYDPSRLVKDTSGSGFGYTDGAAFAQPAEQGEKPNSAKAVLFVVGFMVGIVGLVIASQINPALCISVFGAIFAFFGFMAMGGSKKKYPEDKMVVRAGRSAGFRASARYDVPQKVGYARREVRDPPQRHDKRGVRGDRLSRADIPRRRQEHEKAPLHLLR